MPALEVHAALATRPAQANRPLSFGYLMAIEPELEEGLEPYQRFQERWAHLALPDHIEAAVRSDALLRCDMVDVVFEQLAGTPSLCRRFVGVLDRELGRGLSGGRAAFAALVAVERAAIARRALRDLQESERS